MRTLPRAAVGSLASRVLVAGGGGGAGQAGAGCLAGITSAGGGGNAGGPTPIGSSGANAVLCADETGSQTNGGGGAAATGGMGGTTTVAGNAAGSPGSLGAGGNGAGGGGGGGGLYGGGSGASAFAGPGLGETQSAAGGGGGSSLIPAGGSAVPSCIGCAADVLISYRLARQTTDVAVSVGGTHSAMDGKRFTESVTITNLGPGPAYAQTTTLNIPSHLRLLRAPHAVIRSKKLWWNNELLQPGTSITYRATLRPGPVFRGSARLKALVTSAGSVDTNPANNTASFWVHVNHSRRAARP